MAKKPATLLILMTVISCILTGCAEHLKQPVTETKTAQRFLRMDTSKMTLDSLISVLGADKNAVTNLLGDQYESISTNLSGSIEPSALIYNLDIEEIPVVVSFELHKKVVMGVTVYAQGVNKTAFKSRAKEVFNDKIANVYELDDYDGRQWKSKSLNVRSTVIS